MSPLLYLERLIAQGHAVSAELAPPENTWGLQHAVNRLAASLQKSEFGLDQAVLLRQCIRHLAPGQKIVVGQIAQDVSEHFLAVGLGVGIDGHVKATPFKPSWLTSPAPQGADVPAFHQAVVDEPILGESWLTVRLGKSSWRSQAQREVAWSALSAPHNSTLLVGLPTGAGKSLVYQVCASFQPGLTVVVVPTVALGIDQIHALRSTPLVDTHNPLLYTSDVNSGAVLEAVSDGSCRLVVTSPESIVAGRLGPVLDRHAEGAWFSRIVIDEAHIVDSWGASFRVEFQLLSARLRQWRSLSAKGVRTLLLSATFGPGTAETLKTLFADSEGPWEQYVIQRLRPEIHYFSPGSDLETEEHEKFVSEAVLLLPRPMIMYLTEREKAQQWAQRLKNLGLKRLECFHGETNQLDRNRILEAWRSDEIDIVVATSAFGMGVDKADVRAVLHACYPENIDRYYQEVGRGGRDGAPCSAIALWTTADRKVGSSMGTKLLSDAAKISGRWAAMWSGVMPTESSLLFRIPLWASPDYKLHERTYNESVNWNKRLLLMMERAQLLRIESLSIDTGGDTGEQREWATVHLLESTTNLQLRLPSLLRLSRDKEVSAMDTSRERLDQLLTNTAPVCRLLRQHYGRETYRTCGSCSQCREDPTLQSDSAPLAVRVRQPRSMPQIDIVYGPSMKSSKEEGVIVLALRRTMHSGLTWRFVTSKQFFERANGLLDAAVVQGSLAYRLDLLTHETARSIRPADVVICLHDKNIHSHASVLHEQGVLCAHWILGLPQDQSDVLWPFLHERQSRLFSGPNAINDWINSRSPMRLQTEKTISVH
jgi:ATP-dependent DNA helicase RecQ